MTVSPGDVIGAAWGEPEAKQDYGYQAKNCEGTAKEGEGESTTDGLEEVGEESEKEATSEGEGEEEEGEGREEEQRKRDQGSEDEGAVEKVGARAWKEGRAGVQCSLYAWRTVERLYDKEGRRWWRMFRYLLPDRTEGVQGSGSVRRLEVLKEDQGDGRSGNGTSARLMEACSKGQEEVRKRVQGSDGQKGEKLWESVRAGISEASEEGTSSEEGREVQEMGRRVFRWVKEEGKRRGLGRVPPRLHRGLRMSGVKGRV